MAQFWNNLHKEHSKWKDWKVKEFTDLRAIQFVKII